MQNWNSRRVSKSRLVCVGFDPTCVMTSKSIINLESGKMFYKHSNAFLVVFCCQSCLLAISIVLETNYVLDKYVKTSMLSQVLSLVRFNFRYVTYTKVPFVYPSPYHISSRCILSLTWRYPLFAGMPM